MEYLDMQPDISYTKISDRYHRGISDILACVSSIFVAIESKADGKEPTFEQLKYISGIKKAGGVGGVCYCLKDVKDLVAEARNKKVTQ